MKKILSLLLAFLLPLFLYAWNSSGHMTAGAIAYYYLKENNPVVLKKVLVTLTKHPWYSAQWAEKMSGLTDDQKEVVLFMLASTFPDDARSIPELGGGEKKKWHYIDYPFVPAGQTVTGVQPESPNAEEKILSLIDSLKNQNESADKAINVCWLFHLIEDIHQPLHTVSMFDTNHPNGDKGGNATFIKLSADGATIKLHSYWDGLVEGTINNIPDKAKALLLLEKYKESNLSEIKDDPSVDDWIRKESVELAKKKVYLNGSINGIQDAPTLVDAKYVSDAKEIGERRVVLSGIRLAKELIVLYSH